MMCQTEKNASFASFDAQEKLPDMVHGIALPPLLQTIVGVLGVATNIFILIVLFRFTSLWKKPCFALLINQAAVNVAAGFFIAAQNATILHGDPLMFPHIVKVHSDALCRLWYSRMLMWGALVSSSYNAVAFALERYFMIVHPLCHRNNYNRNSRRIIIAAVWCSGFTYHAVVQLPTTGLVGTSCMNATLWSSKFLRKFFGLSILFVQFYIPLGVLIFAYANIFISLRQRDKIRHESVRNRLSHAQISLLKSSLAVSVWFITCWFVDISLFFLSITEICIIRNTFTRYVDIMIFSNPIGNAVIYTVQLAEFRKGVLLMLSRNGAPNSQMESKRLHNLEAESAV